MFDSDIQVALYPKEKNTISDTKKSSILNSILILIGTGKITHGSKWSRVVSSNLEVSMSSMGCVEVDGQASVILKNIKDIINFAFENGLSFESIYFNNIPFSEIEEIKKEKDLIFLREQYNIKDNYFLQGV